MKRTLIVMLAISCCAFAQDRGRAGENTFFYQSTGPAGVAGTIGTFGKAAAPVQGAPYSATITNEMIQTLADGNRIVHKSTGTIARDSQGRTRQDTPLPAIGNLSVANAPHLVFIQDPVAQTSYTLNLTDKTAQKMPTLPKGSSGAMGASASAAGQGSDAFFIAMGNAAPVTAPMPTPAIVIRKELAGNERAEVTTEDLGSQTMEGVVVNGVRTTRTIPAGQIGNEKPISIVTEVWTSPDLKTIVYSKRSDPQMGEQSFQLTNIVRGEPDPSLFTVPPDFRIVDGPRPIIYRPNQ